MRGQANYTSVIKPRVASLPIVEIDELYHIGSLDPKDKGLYYQSSYEGHGLSVSLDPDEWERIAKLGGGQWWRLSSEGKFIDAHQLDLKQRQQISDWGVANDLVKEIEAWRVSYYDDELDDEVGFLFEDYQEACLEAESWEAKPQKTETLKATQKLEQALGMQSDLDAFDHLLVIWAERTQDCDGIWWADQYGLYSAPRGVIFPKALGRWHQEKILDNQSSR
jgi:hypothetical protein